MTVGNAQAITKHAATGPTFGAADLVVYGAGAIRLSSTLNGSYLDNRIRNSHICISLILFTYAFAAVPGVANKQTTTVLAGVAPPYPLFDVEVFQIVPGKRSISPHRPRFPPPPPPLRSMHLNRKTTDSD